MDDIAFIHIRAAIKLNAFLGYLPFGWSELSAGGRVTFDGSVRKRIAFYAQICLFWSYLAFLTARAYCATYVTPETTSVRTVIQVYAVINYSPVMLQLCNVILTSQLRLVVNRYIIFSEELRLEWNRMKPKRKCKTARNFIRGVLVLATVNILSNLAPIWRNPKALNLLTSLIPGVERMPKWQLVPFAAIHFLILGHTWSVAYLHMSLIIGFTADVTNKLELMR